MYNDSSIISDIFWT